MPVQDVLLPEVEEPAAVGSGIHAVRGLRSSTEWQTAHTGSDMDWLAAGVSMDSSHLAAGVRGPMQLRVARGRVLEASPATQPSAVLPTPPQRRPSRRAAVKPPRPRRTSVPKMASIREADAATRPEKWLAPQGGSGRRRHSILSASSWGDENQGDTDDLESLLSSPPATGRSLDRPSVDGNSVDGFENTADFHSYVAPRFY